MAVKLFDANMRPFEKVISVVTFAFDAVYRVLLEYAKIVLLVIVVIVSAQVISRKFLGTSIRWSEEVALFLMVWMAFISMAIGVERRLHIAIEIFAKRMPKTVQRIAEKINDALICAFGIILVVYGSRLVKTTMSSTLPATQLPAGFSYLMMPVSGVFIAYFSLFSFFNLTKYRHRDVEGDDVEDEKTQSLENADGKEFTDEEGAHV